MEILPTYTPTIEGPARRVMPRLMGKNLAFVTLKLLTAACVGESQVSPTPTPAPAEDVVAAVSCATGREVVSVTYNGDTVNCDDLVGFVPSRADFERVGKSDDVCTGTTTVGGDMRFEKWLPRSQDPEKPTLLTVELRDGTIVHIRCGVDQNGNWFESIEPISPENQ